MTMRALVFSALLIAAGCTVGPRFQPPQVAVPNSWTIPASRGIGSTPVINDAWWQSFQDATLSKLIDRAIAANYELKRAAARIEEARAAHNMTRAGGRPQVNASAAAAANRSLVLGAGGLSIPARPAIAVAEFSSFQAGFDAAWELDVFGRIRRQAQAAEADATALEEDRRDFLVTLLGDVGRYYAELRGLQMRLRIAGKSIRAEEETVTLTEARAKAGLGTDLDVARARAQLTSLEAAIPPIESGIAVTVHALSVLCGQQPGALRGELETPTPILSTPPDIPAGLPSDLLQRRPDVRRAEAEWRAASARVGEAKADYFPRFTLTGSAGRQAAQLHDVNLGLGTFFFSVGPSVSVPIFSGGRIRSNIARQKARLDQSLATYQSTVLRSLQETENALVELASEQHRRDRLSAQAQQNELALELATAQYRAGLADFLVVLDAERELYSNQDFFIRSQTAVVTNLISLYKSLGGAWMAIDKSH